MDSIYSLGGSSSTSGFNLADYTGLGSVGSNVTAPFDINPPPAWLNNLAGVAVNGLSRYLDTENQIRFNTSATANMYSPAALAAAQALQVQQQQAQQPDNSNILLLLAAGAAVYFLMD